MARGEKPTSRSNAIGTAFVGVFGVAALGAILFVILVTHACSSCDAWLYGGGMGMPPDPYVGASTAARLLDWRDTPRLRASWGAVPPLDGAAAHYALAPVLSSRGYLPSPDVIGPITLPADVDVPALDRTCGVLEIEAEMTSRISGAGRGTALRSADDPSVVALGVCGSGPFRIEGVGTALLHAHLMPGLVTGDVERTTLPEEVLLAHAEAELLLAGVAYTASDQILRLETTTASTGSTTFTGLPDPPSGCIPWAVVLVGAGRTRGLTASYPQDFAAERGLTFAVTCAGGTGRSFDLTDAGGDGYIAWARPYGVSSSPSMPAAPTLHVADARVVNLADLVLPASVPAAPQP